MSLKGVAAAVGLGELAPVRYTGEASILDLLSEVATEAIEDAGFVKSDIDGLVVHPISGIPGFVPATVAEYLGLQPTFAELVDLGGATGAGMVWRAAAAIQAGMCTSCLCLTGTRRRGLFTASSGKPAKSNDPSGRARARSITPKETGHPRQNSICPTAC